MALDHQHPPLSARAWLYGRVSRDDQDGRSCDEQLAIGKRECKRDQVEVVGVYRDDDRSASQWARQKREDWQRLVSDLKAHARPGDRLWGWEISRWTRERSMWAQLTQVAQEKKMYFWVDGKLFDANDSNDMFFLDIMVAKSVAEVGDTRKRILRDVEAVAEAGRPTGWPGYGYRYAYDPETGDLLDQVIVPEEAAVLKEAARRVLAGEGPTAVAADFNRRRIPNSIGYVAGQTMPNGKVSKGWTAATVMSMLKRPSIMGKRSHKGKIIEDGGWTPIVAPADWYDLQGRFGSLPADEAASRDGRARHLLSGIGVCGVCGGRVYAQKTRSGGSHAKGFLAYRCMGHFQGGRTGCVTRKRDLIDAFVEEAVLDFFSQPDVLDLFAGDEVGEEEVEANRAQVARLKAELSELYADVRARRVTREMAQASEAGIREELERLEGAVAPRRVDPLARALAGGSREAVAGVWGAWSLEQRRKALRAVTEQIRVLPAGRTGRRRLSAEESVRVFWRGEVPPPFPGGAAS